MFRQYSVHVRRRRAAKERVRILADYTAWLSTQSALPPARPGRNKLLIIRLDDIGDYLLFRNQLAMYKSSNRWTDHSITLLGNSAWRQIFDTHDGGAVDDVIWVNKRQYLLDAAHRWEIWARLRDRGYETVIATSRTRPLLLDDLCMRAAAPARSVGSANSYVHADWNRLSDASYHELFRPATADHEFRFNARFAQWACGVCYPGTRPAIESYLPPPSNHEYIVCFVGANTRSKRWPARRWIQFIEHHRNARSDRIVLAGAGASEIDMARHIEKATGAQNIAGQVSLLELLAWVAGARAVVTNDTMAAHLGVSCNRPTLIVANGVNHQRFTDYAPAGISGVATVYPDRFDRLRKRLGNIECHYEDVVTADIESIRAGAVAQQLELLLAAHSAA